MLSALVPAVVTAMVTTCVPASALGPTQGAAADSTPPTFTSATVPAAAMKAIDGQRTVTFTYHATDTDSGVATYDVRYRLIPRDGVAGEWTSPASMRSTIAASQGVIVLKSTTVCFQARARDHAGNVSAWTTSRCTYVDGTRPTIRFTDVPQRFLPRKLATATITETEVHRRPAVSYAGSDDRRVVRYEVRMREYVGYRPTAVYRTGWSTSEGSTRRTTFRPYLGAGRTVCTQVRAVDAVGHRSTWTKRPCTSLPFAGSALLGDQSKAAVEHQRTSLWPGSSARTFGTVRGGAVRVGYVASPSAGSFDVFVGGRKIGHVDARARTWQVRHTTFRTSTPFAGVRLKFRGTSGYSEIHDFLILRG